MPSNITVITAKDDEHFVALKGLLKTTFTSPVRVMDEGRVDNQLDAERLIGSQRRTLKNLGYRID